MNYKIICLTFLITLSFLSCSELLDNFNSAQADSELNSDIDTDTQTDTQTQGLHYELEYQTDIFIQGTKIGDTYVYDSQNDGNVSANTLDDSFETKWASAGIGQWIQFAWERTQTIKAISIAFSKGDERQAYFEIQTSLYGYDWTSVYIGTSSGLTNDLETFFLNDIEANYVKIIGNGNSEEGVHWNAFTKVEFEFLQDSSTPQTLPSIPHQYPTDVIADLVSWKITLPVDANNQDSSQATSYAQRNTSAYEVKDLNLIDYENAPYFYAYNNEIILRAHAAGATTEGSNYPRSEFRQRVGGADNYWDFEEYQFLSVELRILQVPVIKPEISVMQIDGEEHDPLSVQFSTSKGLHLIWNDDNKKYDLDLDYTLGDRLRIDVTVNNGEITTNITNLENNQFNEFNWESNDSLGYFKVGVKTLSSIFLEEFKTEYFDSEQLDAYGEIAVSKIELYETYNGNSDGTFTETETETETQIDETNEDPNNNGNGTITMQPFPLS